MHSIHTTHTHTLVRDGNKIFSTLIFLTLLLSSSFSWCKHFSKKKKKLSLRINYYFQFSLQFRFSEDLNIEFINLGS